MLKKYTEIWERISNLINIKFDTEPVYGDNDKYIKTKIKIYGEKVNTLIMRYQALIPINLNGMA